MLEFAAMNNFQYSWLLVYLFEALLLVWMYFPVLELEGVGKGKKCTALGFLALAYVLAKWKLENYIFLNILVMISYAGLCLLICSTIIRENVIWMAAVYAVCIEFGRILIYGSIYLTGNSLYYEQHIWFLRFLVSMIKFLMALACRKLVCEYSRYKVHVLDMILMLIAIGNLLFMHYRRRISLSYTESISFEEQTFLVIGFGVLALLAAMLYHIKTYLQEQHLMAMKADMEANYNEIQRNSALDQEIRRIYHDLKHQLAAMDMTDFSADKGERKKLADKLLSHVKDLEHVTESGSPLLDSLLNHKLITAKEKQIQLDVFLETIQYDFIDSMDLCSIFGNAIDNALEAAGQIAQPEQRWVHVKTALVQGIWVLKVENACKQKPVIENGSYISSKPGPKRKGIGIASIRYCAEKYHGNVDIQAGGNTFVLRVTVPVIA